MIRQSLKLVLVSYDHGLLEFVVMEICRVFENAGISSYSVVPLPKKIKKFTCNKSPHKYGYAKEQFQIKRHRRVIVVFGALDREVMDSLVKLQVSQAVDVVFKECK